MLRGSHGRADHARSRTAGRLCARAALGPGRPDDGRRHLPDLSRAADASLPAAVARDLAVLPPERPALVAHPRLSVVHDPVRDLAADGVLQDDPPGARGRSPHRRVLASGLARADRHPDLRPGDPHRRDLHVLARRERVRLRDHVHLELGEPDADGRGADRPHPGRPLQLARDHGGNPDPEHSAGPDLQRVPQSLHRRLHRRGVPLREGGSHVGQQAHQARAAEEGRDRSRCRRGFRRGRAVFLRGADEVSKPAAEGRPLDHPVGALRAGVRRLVRQHVGQAVGREERRPGERRAHQQHAARHAGSGRGGRAERARSLHEPPPDGLLRGSGDQPRVDRQGDRAQGGQVQPARQAQHLQPEDEEVLRRLRQLRARPRRLAPRSLERRRRGAVHVGPCRQGGAQAEGDRASHRHRAVAGARLEHGPPRVHDVLRLVRPERGQRADAELEEHGRGSEVHGQPLQERGLGHLRLEPRVEQQLSLLGHGVDDPQRDLGDTHARGPAPALRG